MFKLDHDSTGIYTEPVVFGPAVNGLEGLGHAEVTRYSVAWQTDGEALSRFLPSDYELSAPVIVIDFEQFERVRWLSGRSFHCVRVQTPVTAGGKPGLFNMVTWEDNGDVCLYDRDVMGVPAEYADFKVTEDAQDSCVTAELSSWGFTFLKLSFKKDTSDDFCRINDLPGDTTFLYRYLPRTGEGFTKHDACYTVCRKHSASRTLTEGALGSAEWIVPGFEQMPIQHTFTRELALLPIIQVCGAGCGRYTYQAPDGEDSIILEAGQDAILDPSKMYMAPANFAACVSPRRRTDGKRYIYDDPINTDRYAVIYEVEHPEELRELVPEGLEPTGGYLIVAVDYLTEIAWLAGKSYALLTVNIPVTSGSTLDDPIKGAFMCAICENEMDPILTGREQLGFCKILCEIEPPRQKDKAFTIVAKEYGREFLKLRDLMAARWTKVTLNACMSGMSAALGSTFGDVMDSKKTMEIIGQVGYEAGMVNKAAGLHFAPVNGIKVDKLFKLGPLTRVIVSKMIPIGYKSMRTAKASMLQDLERGRLTEVDMLNGYICAEGRLLGIKTPANDKIVEIIHGIEDGKYELSFDNLNLF